MGLRTRKKATRIAGLVITFVMAATACTSSDSAVPVPESAETTQDTIAAPARSDIPAGHESHVLVLSSEAVGTQIALRDQLRIIATSFGPDGQATSTALLDDVLVLDTDIVLPPEPVEVSQPFDYVITIAITPDEKSRLTEAVDDGAALYATPSRSGSFVVGIPLPNSLAFDGESNVGDAVDVLDASDPDSLVIVASNVGLREVRIAMSASDPDPDRDPDPTILLVVAASPDESLAIISAIANGPVAVRTSAAIARTDSGQSSRQVLIVTRTIPRGTTVTELVESPTIHLSARAVPSQFVAPLAIRSVAHLMELAGLVLAVDVLPGEQLLTSRFVEISDLDMSSSSPEPRTMADTPPGHISHALVLERNEAVGGNVTIGDRVRVIATSFGSDEQATSTAILDDVQVLGAEYLSPDPATLNQPLDIAITVALTPEMESRLSAVDNQAVLSLAVHGDRDNYFSVGILVPRSLALDGEVGVGDYVDVLVSVDPDNFVTVVPNFVTVARYSKVLAVLNDEYDESADLYLAVTANSDATLAIAAAMADGQIAVTTR